MALEVTLLAALLALLLVAAVIVIVSRPLRRAHPPEAAMERRRIELEARREAKYREIRDAELDYRTGKLSSADYELLSSELRAEALEILDRLQELAERPGGQQSLHAAAERREEPGPEPP